MTTTAEKLQDFKDGTGRYTPRRPYDIPEEVRKLKKQHHDALTNMRKSRDDWRRRCEVAEAGLHVEPKRIRWSKTKQLQTRLEELQKLVAEYEKQRRVRRMGRVLLAVQALEELALLANNTGIYFAAKKVRAALALEEVADDGDEGSDQPPTALRGRHDLRGDQGDRSVGAGLRRRERSQVHLSMETEGRDRGPEESPLVPDALPRAGTAEDRPRRKRPARPGAGSEGLGQTASGSGSTNKPKAARAVGTK